MRFSFLDFDIYYEKYGTSKDNILILPGWGDTRSTFNNLINVLKNNFTVYILDYPGFGNSNFPNRDLDIYDYSGLIEEFIKSNKIDNPIIISHSFGGRISIILSGLKKLPIKKMILIDAACIKRKKKYENILINIFGSNDYKNLDPNIRKTFIKVINEDLTKYLENINTSTLLIWGENDQDTPIEDGKLMNVKIEDSGLIVIPNSSHFPYLEYPYYINKIILEFLKTYI